MHKIRLKNKAYSYLVMRYSQVFTANTGNEQYQYLCSLKLAIVLSLQISRNKYFTVTIKSYLPTNLGMTTLCMHGQ